jgi:Tol biopolymer transport system component
MHHRLNRTAALLLGLTCAAALVPSARAAKPITLTIEQMTRTGAECSGGGSYYPSLDAQAKTLAFTSFCDLVPGQNGDGNSELFIQKTNGNGLRQLTHSTGGVGMSGPTMSSDGELIVFSSANDLVPGGNTDANNEIFVIHADGSGLAQLTHTTGGRAQFGFAGNTHPIFEPSGHRIVFSSDRDLVAGGNADGNNDLFVMDADGGALHQLTFTTGGYGVNTGSLDKAGMRLLFDADRDLVAGQNTDGGSEIFVMNTDGSGLVQLTNSDSSGGYFGNGYPRWTPDGESIFFGSDQVLGINPGDIYEVYHMNGDGSDIVQVTSCLGVFGALPWGVADRGRSVAIESDCDLVPGANPDRNGEVFVETWKPAQFTPSPPGAQPAAARTTPAARGARAAMAPRF